MIIHTEKERDDYRTAGAHLGAVLRALGEAAKPGVSTKTLDDLAEKMIQEYGDEPVFLGYVPQHGMRPYPAVSCISVNDEVVHGIPNESPRILKEGDIVTLDLGLSHEGLVVDSALTVAVGKLTPKLYALVNTTDEALHAGIAEAKVGNHIGDISHAIQTVVEKNGFSIVKELGGHGVGHTMHEDPFIPNFGKAGRGEELVEGMVIAIEPIVSEGKGKVIVGSDGWVYRTRDGSPAAHFEHTVLVVKDGPMVLTER